MDPRLRARMIAVRRQAGRRRLKGGLIAGIVVAVLALAAVATRLPILSVGSVQVSGATYTDPALVADVVRAIDGSSMLSVDLGSARRRSRPARGSSGSASPRTGPGACASTSPSARPSAGYLATDGQFRVIDDEGHVHRRPRRPAHRLPGHRPHRPGLRRRPRSGAGPAGAGGHRRRRPARAGAARRAAGQGRRGGRERGGGAGAAPAPAGHRAARFLGRHAGQAHQPSWPCSTTWIPPRSGRWTCGRRQNRSVNPPANP